MSHRHLFILPFFALAACEVRVDADGRPDRPDRDAELTETDARVAVDQVNLVSRPDVASVELIDVSTDITIGDRIAMIADRWRSFWESQAPCNEVTVEENVITVDFGDLDDACTYGGDSYAGVDTITLTQVLDFDDDLRVDHEWSGFTNGEIVMDGTTGVYWSGEGLRHVEIDHTFTRAADEAEVHVTGQHTLRRLDAALPAAEGGFQLNGTRSWDDGTGAWTVELNELHMQVDDASPFDGDVVVTAPNGRELTIEYSRIDEDTTRAIVVGPRGDTFVFRITAEGELTVD